MTGNSAGASVTDAVSDVSIYVGDKAQEAADSLKRFVYVPFFHLAAIHLSHICISPIPNI